MKDNFFKHFMRLLLRKQIQPVIGPKQGDNPTKRGYSISGKSLKARRKVLRLRQKASRRANRR